MCGGHYYVIWDWRDDHFSPNLRVKNYNRVRCERVTQVVIGLERMFCVQKKRGYGQLFPQTITFETSVLPDWIFVGARSTTLAFKDIFGSF